MQKNIFYRSCQVAARVAKLVLCGAVGTLILEEREVVVSALHSYHCAISNHSARICYRMSRRSNRQGWVTLEKIGADQFKPNFNAIWE